MTGQHAPKSLSGVVRLAADPPARLRVSAAFRAAFAVCRTSELLLIAYFSYTAILASLHSLPGRQQLAAWSIPCLLWLGAAVETKCSRRWSSIVRDWVPLACILPGYWQIDWFAYAEWNNWHGSWIAWDRMLLDRLGMRAAIEAFGWPIPALLETAYLLLYAVPPVGLGAVYWWAGRRQADRYLTTLLSGTLLVYVLLPHFPTISPRLAFPHQDLPSFMGISRSINVFLLDHFDVSRSVFPSGHVAVAFSAAFGLIRAVRSRKGVWGGAFVLAAAIFVATIYCRYHYAADGVASIALSAFAWRMTEGLTGDA